MTRGHRYVHGSAFGEARTFDEQTYRALKNSPWWMISIAAHVVVFAASSLFATPEALARPAEEARILVPPGPAEPPPEPEPEPSIDPPSPVPIDPTSALEPVPDPEVIQPHPETDDDMPNESTNGSEGLGRVELEGPSRASPIGIGPGGARPFGKRGGGDDWGGPPGGNGPTQQTEDAVLHALRWLAAHQSPDGRWEAAGFHRWFEGKPAAPPGPDGLGKAQHDVGVTGLAILAFLGAGYGPRTDHEFGRVVSRGLRFLKSQQDAEGAVGSRSSGHHVYDHAIAALALVEAYGMTGSAVWKNPAQRALDFVAVSRNPYAAWRYGVKPGDNDTSVTGWTMMALKSARLVNADDRRRGRAPSLVLDEDAFDGIRSWIDKMTDPETGRVGYQVRGSGPARPYDLADRFPSEKSEAMTAVGVLARVFLGENPKVSRPVRDGAALCARALPTWADDGSIDMYYWYYGTLAMFQVGGEPWAKWNVAMKRAIVDRQRVDGDYSLCKGSWDPVDPWGADGGRVYSTALLAMCLEVYYRYGRVFGTSVEGSR